MHQVLIAIGSNHHQSAHIQWASERLSVLLSNLQLSRKLWTPDIHSSGQWYMNRLAAGFTDLTADEIAAQLKEIEAAAHRSKQCITLDLDLMQYDHQRHHLRDWPRPYIQLLLPDISIIPYEETD